MWIKICGNTNLEDARLAIEGGADALGFVFAPSPRKVTAAEVQRITAALPGGVRTIGVFVDASFAEITETVTTAGLNGIQLQRWTETNLPARLREHFSGRQQVFSILGVLRYGFAGSPMAREKAPATEDLENGMSLEERSFNGLLDRHIRNPAFDAILVDSGTAQLPGGTGKTFDWARARGSFLRGSSRMRMIAAGGLRAENVREAILTLEPWGIDVVSGVEAMPGKKDPERLLRFLRSAREAAALIGSEAPAASL